MAISGVYYTVGNYTPSGFVPFGVKFNDFTQSGTWGDTSLIPLSLSPSNISVNATFVTGSITAAGNNSYSIGDLSLQELTNNYTLTVTQFV